VRNQRPNSHKTRQAVSKYPTILEEANLVSSIRQGREKQHYSNPESWFGTNAEALLAFAGHRRSGETSGFEPVGRLARRCLFRQHGTPRVYYSDYTPDRLRYRKKSTR
jgi:hypothetical protein